MCNVQCGVIIVLCYKMQCEWSFVNVNFFLGCSSPMQVKVGRPDAVLGVICGSLCIAEQAFRKRFADYQAHLER